MNINFHSKGIDDMLEEEKKYMSDKITETMHRSHYADEKDDIKVKIEIDKESSVKNDKKQFFCSITVDLPGKILRAENHCAGIYSSFDSSLTNIKKQLEKEKNKHIHV